MLSPLLPLTVMTPPDLDLVKIPVGESGASSCETLIFIYDLEVKVLP